MHQKSDKILKLPEVITRTTLSRSSIYLYVKRGLFPAPMKLGLRSTGWFESEIEDWLMFKRIENPMHKIIREDN